jgi:uncharacterized protein YutE (UPF0331/DUF86 family)
VFVVGIDRERIKRFISEIRNAILFISKCLEKSFEELTDSDKYAIRYNIIVIAEAISAIALHICRNIYGLEPETPIHALRLLADKSFIQRSLFEELAKIIRLRNLLVHRYWVIDDKIIYDSIKRNFRYVEEFIERVSLLAGSI